MLISSICEIKYNICVIWQFLICHKATVNINWIRKLWLEFGIEKFLESTEEH